MDNICKDMILFYQENGGTDKLEKLHEAFDIFPCNESEDILPNWIGFLTRRELGISENLDDRCIYTGSFVKDEGLLVYAQSINTPKTEVYSKIADHFGVKYHLLAEEPENQIFINTDIEREYFDNEFAVTIICEEEDLIADLQFQLDDYYSSIESLLEDFASIGYTASSLQGLKELLAKEANEMLSIVVTEYQNLNN